MRLQSQKKRKRSKLWQNYQNPKDSSAHRMTQHVFYVIFEDNTHQISDYKVTNDTNADQKTLHHIELIRHKNDSYIASNNHNCQN